LKNKELITTNINKNINKKLKNNNKMMRVMIVRCSA